jgi:KDO2-lipid IV(A) lauroyltransferase
VNVDGEASLSLAGPGQPSRARRNDEAGSAPRLRDLRFRLEYAALRGVIGVLRLVPLRLSVRWSATLWRILAPRLNPKRQRIALENLRIAFPDKDEQERFAICAAHWENLGRVVAEIVQVDRLLKDPTRIEIPDLPVLARYRKKLGPVIGVSLHSGNWELAIWPLVLAGANPAALYRAVGNPYIDRYLKAKRQALCPAGLIGRHRSDASPLEDLQTAHRLMDYVRKGGRVGIICDQFYKRGVPVPFFGRMTLVPPIAAMIARRTGARVWMARCLRVGTDSRFRIEVKELRVARTANQADDVRNALSAIHAQFETWIREAPSQWLWSHRIWR